MAPTARRSSCGAPTARKSAPSAITASRSANSTTSIRSSPTRRATSIPAKSTPACGCKNSRPIWRRRSRAKNQRAASAPIAAALQQCHRLIERQADDIAVGTVDEAHEGFRAALNGIAAGLALPFPNREIIGDLGVAKDLEGDARSDNARANLFAWDRERQRGHDLMAATRKQLETTLHFARAPGLG